MTRREPGEQQDNTWMEMFQVTPPVATGFSRKELPEGVPAGAGIIVRDNPLAAPVLCALTAAFQLENLGYRPTLEIACRDFNRIAMQSRVLGALAMGITRIVLTDGMHQAVGSIRRSQNVYDLDPFQGVTMLQDMRLTGRLSNGVEIAGDCDFQLGIRINPFNGPHELRWMMLGKTILSGADFVVLDGGSTETWSNLINNDGFAEMKRMAGTVKIIGSVELGAAPPGEHGLWKALDGVNWIRKWEMIS